MDIASFARRLPKAELHVHIEGTLEPEMMFDLAARNGIALPFASVDEVRSAYQFANLDSFLDIYYRGASVLITQQDYYDLMSAYLERAHEDGVRRAEIFFDAQTHTQRGIGFDVFMDGFTRAAADASAQWGISCGLIMCFLRHLPAEAAVDTWRAAEPFVDQLLGVGLDSSEMGNPPAGFVRAFEMAHAAGLHTVAHAGEEGPPAYIEQALDVLGAERIDHGVRSEESTHLVERLAYERVPLTMCPLSNVKLRVFDRIEDHNLKRLLDRGVPVTINSDDPAYFGGYLLDNYVAVATGLDLTEDDVVHLAANSINASFLSEPEKDRLREEIEAVRNY